MLFVGKGYAFAGTVLIRMPCISLIWTRNASVTRRCCLTVDMPLKSTDSMWISYMAPQPPDTSCTWMSLACGKRARSNSSNCGSEAVAAAVWPSALLPPAPPDQRRDRSCNTSQYKFLFQDYRFVKKFTYGNRTSSCRQEESPQKSAAGWYDVFHFSSVSKRL